MDFDEVIDNLQSATEKYTTSLCNGNDNKLLLLLFIDAIQNAESIGISREEIEGIINMTVDCTIKAQPTHVEINCDIV